MKGDKLCWGCGLEILFADSENRLVPIDPETGRRHECSQGDVVERPSVAEFSRQSQKMHYKQEDR